MATERPIILATRGSALALAQTQMMLDQCRQAFPKLRFEIKIIKTTGDKMLTASLTNKDGKLPKGLFTKDLEVALVKGHADLAIHSLKDLPTELPQGLILGAVSKRADVRDVLIYRDAEYLKSQVSTPTSELSDWSPGHSERRGFKPKLALKDLPKGATIATSSPRRREQLLAHRPDLKIVEIRGNVVTRMNKLMDKTELDVLVLAAAGLERLNFKISSNGKLEGDAVPDGLLATPLETNVMIPCVGQAAIGIEIRANDERITKICERLNHFNTQQCVTAERAFLAAMGGGCASPVGAYAEVVGEKLSIKAISFADGTARRAEAKGSVKAAEEIGKQLASELKPGVAS